MAELKLHGCTPEPLSNYLKALGVLRLVVEQNQDRKAKAYWHDDGFVMVTHLSQDNLMQFFLHHYQPTPLVAPWNGSTGFYPKDNPKTLLAILNSQTPRLADYRQTILIAQQQVQHLKLINQPKDKDTKRKLLTQLRNHLPNRAVKWLDACALITEADLKFPPLLGTGGNDGNFEFSRTFMQQLQELFDLATGKPQANTASLLSASLFAAIVPGLAFAGKIGQFNPIAAGGANAAPGYEAPSRVNPWDFVLMLEGVMLLTSGATRRYEQSESGDFAYPFTVRPSSVGYGSASDGDEIRAEFWAPLWCAPASLAELQNLFHEGRAKVEGRTARTGTDFARAIASQGEMRGIEEFIRYSFQVRNGLSYFAIPLGRLRPKFQSQVNRLTEIDKWLNQFARASQDRNAPNTVKRVHRNLETVLFEFSTGKKELLDVLIALGEVEAVLSRSLAFSHQHQLSPLPLLSREWIQDCYNNQPEFRLALALTHAGNKGLRPRLVHVKKEQIDWNAKEGKPLADGTKTWREGSLVNNLIGLLQREELEIQLHQKKQDQEPAEESNTDQKKQDQEPAEESNTEKNHLTASLDDIVRWINQEVNDARLEAIARGLALVKRPRTSHQANSPTLPIPATYALVTIAHRRTLKHQACQQIFKYNVLGGEKITLPRVPALLTKLAAGDSYTATSLAIRRLYASGLNPGILEGIYEPSERTRRIAAALAFPISDLDLARLYKQIRRYEPNEDKGKGTAGNNGL